MIYSASAVKLMNLDASFLRIAAFHSDLESGLQVRFLITVSATYVRKDRTFHILLDCIPLVRWGFIRKKMWTHITSRIFFKRSFCQFDIPCLKTPGAFRLPGSFLETPWASVLSIIPFLVAVCPIRRQTEGESGDKHWPVVCLIDSLASARCWL